MQYVVGFSPPCSLLKMYALSMLSTCARTQNVTVVRMHSGEGYLWYLVTKEEKVFSTNKYLQVNKKLKHIFLSSSELWCMPLFCLFTVLTLVLSSLQIFWAHYSTVVLCHFPLSLPLPWKRKHWLKWKAFLFNCSINLQVYLPAFEPKGERGYWLLMQWNMSSFQVQFYRNNENCNQ